MNELNQEEPSRYIPVERCDFLIDFDDGTNGNSDEPNFVEVKNHTKFIVFKKKTITKKIQ